jgi:hypothetical protein
VGWRGSGGPSRCLFHLCAKGLLTVFLALILSSTATSQLIIHIIRDGVDVDVTLDTDGTVSCEEGWLQLDFIDAFQIPEWLIPDGFNQEFTVGNDDLEVPGDGVPQLAVEIAAGLADAIDKQYPWLGPALKLAGALL